jgi:hypothetical protein
MTKWGSRRAVYGFGEWIERKKEKADTEKAGERKGRNKESVDFSYKKVTIWYGNSLINMRDWRIISED